MNFHPSEFLTIWLVCYYPHTHTLLPLPKGTEAGRRKAGRKDKRREKGKKGGRMQGGRRGKEARRERGSR